MSEHSGSGTTFAFVRRHYNFYFFLETGVKAIAAFTFVAATIYLVVRVGGLLFPSATSYNRTEYPPCNESQGSLCVWPTLSPTRLTLSAKAANASSDALNGPNSNLGLSLFAACVEFLIAIFILFAIFTKSIQLLECFIWFFFISLALMIVFMVLALWLAKRKEEFYILMVAVLVLDVYLCLYAYYLRIVDKQSKEEGDTSRRKSRTEIPIHV